LFEYEPMREPPAVLLKGRITLRKLAPKGM